MNKFSRQQGYTLFLTVLVVVIFSILAMTLLTVTLSGAKKSEVREDVTQAGELAEKGVNHLLQEIQLELQNEINQHVDGMLRSDFTEVLDNTIKEYMCPSNIVTGGEQGRYDTCIVEKLSSEKYILPQIIKIESIGRVDNKTKKYHTTVELGANMFPEDMQYVVNTPVSKKCAESKSQREKERNCLPGEGNLFLHGGVSIQGDMNIERHLITSNRSYDKYGAIEHWLHSYYPSATKKPDGSTPSVLIGGNVYHFYWKDNGTTYRPSGFNYSTHIKNIDLENSNLYGSIYKKKDVIDDEVFVGANVAQRSERLVHPEQYTVDISSEQIKYKYGPFDPDPSGRWGEVTRLNTKNAEAGGGINRQMIDLKNKYDHVKFFPYLENDRTGPKFDGNFYLFGENTFKQFATNGNLYIGRALNTAITKQTDVGFKDGAYIHGNLTIRNKVNVKGPIYVNGDLTIDGSDVSIDSVIYVNGNVSFGGTIAQHTDESGREELEKCKGQNESKECQELIESEDTDVNGKFIIYANGEISVKRINRFNNGNPPVINGFFYSKKSIEIEGNESKFILKGGISAPRVVLNSIRGRSIASLAHKIKNHQSAFGGIPVRYFSGWEEQARSDSTSRLQITFDNEIFEKYSDLVLESRAKYIERPKILEVYEVNE